MSRWLDKLISELKWKCWSKFDIDGIQNQIKKMHEAPDEAHDMVVRNWDSEAIEDGVAVVEVEAVPVEEVEVSEENCPECGQTPCVCEEEKPESWEAEEPKLPDETEAWEDTNSETVSDWENEVLEEVTPAEEDRMQEILKAIKTFFPNENTEDVLVRLVQKLIDL